MVITSHRHLHAVLLTCLTLAATISVTAQKNDQSKDTAKQLEAKRPKVTLRAQPPVGVAPFRVVLTGELQGGSDDFEDYYCPGIEWEWGDGTTSENSSDCAPYEPGKSEIRRRFTVEHVFKRFGNYRVIFQLKRCDKAVASASVTLQVREGVPQDGQ